ncbi:MAG: protein translocase subunit SecF, partial [Clostridia bacterium]|nr:protein translocase subunit SecF [Clostridia bacterium]
VALVLDLFVAFFTAVIFRLQVDMTFLAVILTILGYSLNDTIVVYDRIRENKGIYPDATTAELVNTSLNTVKIRTIITTITTFLAVVMIIVVAEVFGLTSLRSFAIPMAVGLISGCISSLFISAPLWVIWKNRLDKKVKVAKNKVHSR